MEAALGTGQMSHAAAPGHLIKPAVSLIPLIDDCVYYLGCECKAYTWKPLYNISFNL